MEKGSNGKTKCLIVLLQPKYYFDEITLLFARHPFLKVTDSEIKILYKPAWFNKHYKVMCRKNMTLTH